MRKVIPILAAASLLLGVQAARAESGADALLEAAASKAGGNTAAAQAFGAGNIQANNMFLIQFMSAWQGQKNLPYEMNAWAMRVVKGEYEDAAHLWTAIQPVIPADFQNDAKAAMLYCLWNLNVPQTFFNRFVELLREPSFASSRAEFAFEATIAPEFDHWLLANAIFANEEQIAIIDGLSDTQGGAARITLQALASLKKGIKGQALLDRMLPTNALALPLAQTVSLALVRKGDVPAAARVLKLHVEPALNRIGDPRALARHYLAVARLLYQAGSLDGAEIYYQKIPSGTPDFLTAREELDWVWLRKGDLSRLRGELKTLSLGLFDERFAPEVYLVRAISNLKLCYYDQAEKDFQAFLKSGKHWGGVITAALGAENPPVPADKDFFSNLSDLALKKRAEEVPRLEMLAQRSISAALPAVGPQKHWVDARDRVRSDLEIARKRQNTEYRRQWTNQKTALTEAIRKMKFVKVELMSQLRTALLTQPTSDDVMTTSAAAPVRQAIHDADMSFPFDGVVWTDELFKLRGVVQGKCLGSH
jgi:hypothetical protein